MVSRTSLLPKSNDLVGPNLPPSDRKLLGMTEGVMSAMSFGFNQIAGRLDGIENALWIMNE